MAHALNQLVRVSVSSYDCWPLDDENIREMAREDLREAWVNGGHKFTIHNPDGSIYKELTDDRALDVDVDYWDWSKVKEWFGEIFQECIEQAVPDLADRLKKYGLLYHGMSYRSPKYYNYDNDELEIHLSEDQLEDDDLPPRQVLNPELIPLVEKYIAEVRVPSYDGYCSFEPTDVNKVDRSDYAFLWAILQKEWIYDTIREAIVDAYEPCNEFLFERALVRYLYRYEDEKWEKHCDKIYYDGEWLVVESQWY